MFFFVKKALEAPKVILSIDYKKTHEKEEKRPPSPSPPPPEPVKVEAPVQTPDLLVIHMILFSSLVYTFSVAINVTLSMSLHLFLLGSQ